MSRLSLSVNKSRRSKSVYCFLRGTRFLLSSHRIQQKVSSVFDPSSAKQQAAAAPGLYDGLVGWFSKIRPDPGRLHSSLCDCTAVLTVTDRPQSTRPTENPNPGQPAKNTIQAHKHTQALKSLSEAELMSEERETDRRASERQHAGEMEEAAVGLLMNERQHTHTQL